MNKLLDPRYIIGFGIFCFGIALGNLLIYCPDQVYNWHRCLNAFGWIGAIGGYCLSCYNMMMAGGDDEDDFERCSECDGHDACEDFGCAIKSGLGHLLNRPL